MVMHKCQLMLNFSQVDITAKGAGSSWKMYSKIVDITEKSSAIQRSSTCLSVLDNILLNTATMPGSNPEPMNRLIALVLTSNCNYFKALYICRVKIEGWYHPIPQSKPHGWGNLIIVKFVSHFDLLIHLLKTTIWPIIDLFDILKKLNFIHPK